MKQSLLILYFADLKMVISMCVGMPYIVGFDLAKMKQAKFDVPMTFLSARIGEVEMVTDDYIAKSFVSRVVLAKIKRVLRLQPKQKTLSKCVSIGHFVLDKESAFIRFFHRAFLKSQLIERKWQDNLKSMIDTYVKTIRQKLVAINPACKQPVMIHRQLGYSLSI